MAFPCTGLPVYWPSRVPAYKVAVATIADERAASVSRKDTSVSVYAAFEYDDQTWKANDNERSFGMG
jgi:exo-beta-1,3-glucanase (GH17 family)